MKSHVYLWFQACCIHLGLRGEGCFCFSTEFNVRLSQSMSRRCRGPSGVSAGQPAARSCYKLPRYAPLQWRMRASNHRRTCLSHSSEGGGSAWEPAMAWQACRRCCRRSSARGGGRRRNGQACKLRVHMSQQSGQRGAASGRR